MNPVSWLRVIFTVLTALPAFHTSPVISTVTSGTAQYSDTDLPSANSTAAGSADPSVSTMSAAISSSCSGTYDTPWATADVPRWLRPCSADDLIIVPEDLKQKYDMTSVDGFLKALEEVTIKTMLRESEEIYSMVADLKSDVTWSKDVAAAGFESRQQFYHTKLEEDANETLHAILKSHVIFHYERVAFVSEIVGKMINGSKSGLHELDKALNRTLCQLHVISFVADHLSAPSSRPPTLRQCQLISNSAATSIVQYRGPSTSSDEADNFRYFIGKSAANMAASLASDLERINEIATPTLTSSRDVSTMFTSEAVRDAVATGSSYT